MLKVEILDDDLRELIFKGKNKGKYKKYARVFGRLDRDMRAIEEAARQEEIKQKKAGKKKKIEESEN